MKEEIIDLYNQLGDKTKFLAWLSDKNGRRFGTLKSHWFAPSGGYSIPESELLATKNYLEEFKLKNQKATA